MRLPFSILRTRSDGSLAWVEDAATLEAAKARIEVLAQFWPGEYIISNRATGERVSITIGGEPKEN